MMVLLWILIPIALTWVVTWVMFHERDDFPEATQRERGMKALASWHSQPVAEVEQE